MPPLMLGSITVPVLRIVGVMRCMHSMLSGRGSSLLEGCMPLNQLCMLPQWHACAGCHSGTHVNAAPSNHALPLSRRSPLLPASPLVPTTTHACSGAFRLNRLAAKTFEGKDVTGCNGPAFTSADVPQDLLPELSCALGG